jgi:putative ABC transport system substrate-binding protein
LDQQRIGALMVASDNVFSNESTKLGQASARHNVPVISAYRNFASAGGLMSYGTSETDAYRQAGVYVRRILKGEKPADLSVVQAVKVDLVLNQKTAKTLGLTFPLTLLGRADEVIE